MPKSSVYLDHNASAPILPQAAEAVGAALALCGNASSVHAGGRAVRAAIEDARAQVAKAAGAERRDVVFTGSATEALTQAIVGGVTAFGIDAIMTGAGEHLAVHKAAEAAQRSIHTVGLDENGVLQVEDVEIALEEMDKADITALFAFQLVNNETGIVQPIAEIERLIGPTRHVLVVDAVQAFGKINLDFAARAADMMAVSAHKIGGPAGAGALFVKPHCDEVRLIPGGGQELGRRGGTEPLLNIAGFGAAASHFAKSYEAAGVKALSERIEAEILALAPDAVIFGREGPRIGNTVDFAVPGLSAAVALMALDLDGVAISSGSACSSGKVGRSHVLAAMGVTPELMDGALRVSFGWNSAEMDVTAFVAAFTKLLKRRQNRNKEAAA